MNFRLGSSLFRPFQALDKLFTDPTPCYSGSIQQSLIELGVIGEPTKGRNEVEQKWVGETDFLLSRSIPLLPKKKHHVLQMKGVDTAAEIKIGGKTVGKTASEFVNWEIKLEEDVVSQDSPSVDLSILLRSPISYCQEEYDQYYKKNGYYVDSSHYTNGIRNFNFLRKTSCSFAWDWGPSVPTLSIGEIGILSYEKGYITEAKCVVKEDRREERKNESPSWIINVSAFLVWHSPDCPSLQAEIWEVNRKGEKSKRLESNEGQWKEERKEETRCKHHSSPSPSQSHSQSDSQSVKDEKSIQEELLSEENPYRSASSWKEEEERTFKCILLVSAPYWRVACSDPSHPVSNSIYKVFIKLKEENYEVSRAVGFRRVELERRPDVMADLPLISSSPTPPLGESFYFSINGSPIFAKGSNYIPPSVYATRGGGKQEEGEDESIKLLRLAVSSGMNCLRIWGGGRYETDEFYLESDRLGIMLWHDMMMACSLFPSHPLFLFLIRIEIRHQLSRLAGHPSIVLWAANNENEELLQGHLNTEEMKRNKKLSLQLQEDYDMLYLRTILPLYEEEMRMNEERKGDEVEEEEEEKMREEIAKNNDNHRYLAVPFWPSSPSNGVGVGGIAGDQHRGDVHYWGVWHGNKPFEAFQSVLPRFCSEFGFQSAPNFHILYKEIMGRKLNWKDDRREDEKLNWTSPELEFLQRSPARGNLAIVTQIGTHMRMPVKFEGQVWASQVLQGLAMKSAISFWRRLQPYCMGALYWQLNDIWTGMSWSTINHTGAWKASHYFVKRAFAHLSLFFSFRSSLPPFPSTEDTPFSPGDSLDLWLTSDFEGHTPGLRTASSSSSPSKLVLQAWDLSSSTPFMQQCIENIPYSTKSSIVWRSEALEAYGEKRNVLLRASLFCPSSGSLLTQSEHYFLPIKRLNLRDPKIRVKVVLQTNGEDFENFSFSSSRPSSLPASSSDSSIPPYKIFVTLTCESIALYVTVPELGSGWLSHWSDNAFTLYPDEPRSIFTHLDPTDNPFDALLLEDTAVMAQEIEKWLLDEILHVFASFSPS